MRFRFLVPLALLLMAAILGGCTSHLDSIESPAALTVKLNDSYRVAISHFTLPGE